ncbi:PhzF family phenazine biosynthesis isomerase [Temperatibacter marinus]|uniref:PhzF family phenazine biosynthesis isomerase n=1 Tax=Temperatibacter marinus TaxID=1456591 RepID=A0AA52H901_9PROT|nr:PhzF family phenazine biosynthesis isomerase [Temperatibacter marinus]WND02002.1 PhzF family phenazine biosynthesis isomerase [Temperatibacter marinus]
MAEVPIFQVDVFSSDQHLGNPAAVCPLTEFLENDILQAVARESNLSETAFIVPTPDKETDFDIKWFTPNSEVDLCGHATIAAASIVLSFLETDWEQVSFDTIDGPVHVNQRGGLFSITLPMIDVSPIEAPTELKEALNGFDCKHIYHSGTTYHIVYESRETLAKLDPDFDLLKQSTSYGFIASAPDETGETDFVTRCFYPSLDIEEDPVTLTAYRIVVGHWASEKGKDTFMSHQLSNRGGQLWLKKNGRDLTISGEATMISQGSLFIAGLD